jgi:ubiquinone/menaquinone biosynthesis C-methylase UbiE
MNERQLREKTFHDAKAREIEQEEQQSDYTLSFTSSASLENQFILKQMGELKGKHILDLGCGEGEAALYFAQQGAQVDAVDISEGMINLLRIRADQLGFSIQSHVMEAEVLQFSDHTFDFVYANGVLHHVDMEPTLREIKRVLKPGGCGFFIEPIDYNPVIKVYRTIAEANRSEDETPLRYKDRKVFKKIFDSFNHREFWFTALYIFIHFFVIKRYHPSKVRYWKQVVIEGNRYRTLLTILISLDRVLLLIVPFFRFLCWNTVIQVQTNSNAFSKE